MNPIDRYYQAKHASNSEIAGFLALCRGLQARRDSDKPCLTSPQNVDYRPTQTATLLETAYVP